MDYENTSIVFFCFLLGGMVGILKESGAVHSLATVSARWATSSKRGMLLISFDSGYFLRSFIRVKLDDFNSNCC